MPLQDNDRYLTWNQYSVTRREHDLVGNIGLGQRWRVGGWLLGYNSFYDKVLSESARGSVGAEAWGEYLRLSATITIRWATGSYAIIRLRSSGWPQGMTSPPARGCRSTSTSTPASASNSISAIASIFHSGTGYHNPVAVSVGLNYTPVPLVTVTAKHKQGKMASARTMWA